MAYVDIQNGDDSDGILLKLNKGLALADKSVTSVDTMQELCDLPTDLHLNATISGFHSAEGGGGGGFYWDASHSKTEHNGGTIIDPLKGDQLGDSWPGTWFTPASSGTGCWKRVSTKVILPEDFGAYGNGIADDALSIQAAEDYLNSLGVPSALTFGNKDYTIGSSIFKKANINWVGSGLIRRINNSTVTSGNLFALVVAYQVDLWRIDGISFENIGRDRQVANPGLISVSTRGKRNSCIEVIECSNWLIQNCDISKFQWGIIYQTCHKFSITNNIVRADNGKSIDQYIDNTYIDFDSYSGFAIGIMYETGYDVGGPTPASSDYIISNNVIDAIGLDVGIEGLSQTYDRSPCLITDNVIQGPHCGIQVYRGSFPTTNDINTFDNGLTISNNLIRYTYEQGIYLRGQVGGSVIGNRLYRTGVGPKLNTSSCAIIFRVNPFYELTYGENSIASDDHWIICRDNTCVDHGCLTTTSDDAVIQIELNNVLFTGNVINRTKEFSVDAYGAAIYIGNGKGTLRCKFINNVIEGNFTYALYVNPDFRIKASKEEIKNTLLVIKDNNFFGNYTSGLHVNWKAFNAIIENNTLIGNIQDYGIYLRYSPGAIINNNKLSGNIGTGILISNNCLASDYPKILSGGTSSSSNRRGSTIICNNNNIVGALNSLVIANTDTYDATTFSRFLSFKENIVNNVPFDFEFTGTPQTTYSPKTWNKGDIAKSSILAIGASPGKICISPGTNGDPATTTADSTASSSVLTNIANINSYGPGIYLDVSAGFSNPVCITDIDLDNNTITLDKAATSTEVGVTLNLAAPVFASLPVLT